MQRLKQGLDHQIAHFSPDAKKALKIAQNNATYEKAVRQTWFDNPDAAEYLLAHTNSLYFAKDETPRKGIDKAVDRFVMGVYLDDPMARSELNARREVLMLALMRNGMKFDELRIIPSTLGMRERHLFPQSIEKVAGMFGNGRKTPESGWTPHNLDASQIAQLTSQIEDPAVASAVEAAMHAYATPTHSNSSSAGGRAGSVWSKEPEGEEALVLKRAFCLAMEDIDLAQTLYEQIEHASFELCRSKDSTTPPAYRRYWCTLYVANPDLYEKLFGPYREAVMARARELDLSINSIAIRQAN